MTTRDVAARQRDLLLALFADDDQSLAAWSRWQLHADIERLTPREFRLQPALARRLDAHGISHAWLPRLRGVYRYCWSSNQLTRRDQAEVFGAMQMAGVPIVALAGLPMVRELYGDVAGRQVDSVDILVANDHAASARDVLASLGWRARTSLPPAHLQSVTGPVTFARGAYRHVVLHFHLAPAPVMMANNDAVHARAPRVPFDQLQLPVLEDVDQLVWSCALSPEVRGGDLLSWAPDTILLLRRIADSGRAHVVWERASALGVGGRVAARVEQLRSLLGDVLTFIPVAPDTLVDHAHVWALLDPPGSIDATFRRLGRAPARAVARYRAWCASTGVLASPPGFFRFVADLYRHEWNVTLLELPLALWRRVLALPHAAESSGAAVPTAKAPSSRAA